MFQNQSPDRNVSIKDINHKSDNKWNRDSTVIAEFWGDYIKMNKFLFRDLSGVTIGDKM